MITPNYSELQYLHKIFCGNQRKSFSDIDMSVDLASALGNITVISKVLSIIQLTSKKIYINFVRDRKIFLPMELTLCSVTLRDLKGINKSNIK